MVGSENGTISPKDRLDLPRLSIFQDLVIDPNEIVSDAFSFHRHFL